MPANPQMGAAAMAGGMPPPQQGMPAQSASPVQGASGGQVNVQEIIDALKQAIPQVTDDKGYVDVSKLIMLWQQFSQIPFQTVMQLIQQSPEILTDIIAQYGLAGINVNGRMVSADELASLGGRGAQ